MRSPVLALSWQLWRCGRFTIVSLVILFLATAIIIRVFPELFRDPEMSGPLPALFLFVVLMLGVAVSLSTKAEKATAPFPSWMLTLPVRTEILIGWPMLSVIVWVALAWVAWVELILRPCDCAAPWGWPALLFAAVAAWFRVAILPTAKSARHLLKGGLVLGLLALGIVLLVDRSRKGETGLWLSWANAVPEPLLAGLFGALIPAAYLAGVNDLACLRRGDRPLPLQSLANLDFPWLSGWLTRRRTRQFASPHAAQFWLDWREYGLALPFCWAVLQALGLVVLLTRIVQSQVFPDTISGTILPADLWLTLCSIFCVFAIVFGTLLGCPFKSKEPNLRLELALPTFAAVRPLTTGDLVVVRLGVIALSVFITWALMVAESVLLIVISNDQTLPELYSIDSGTGVPLLLVGILLWLWKQASETLWFGLSGRGWVVLSGLALHCVLSFTVLTGILVHLDGIWAGLQVPPPWLIALVGSAVLIKLSAAAWAIREIQRRQLLATRPLLALLGLWLLSCVGLFAILVVLLSADPIFWPWLACGTVLMLPLARIAWAPLTLAWNRHR
jgi:hypothetical protein